jgi:hypothetical protein
MTASSFFRLSIVLSVALAVVGAFIDAMPGLIPEELWHAYETVVPQDIRTKDIVLIVIGLPLLLATVVSIVGLFRFRPWSPRAALSVSIASVLIYPLIDIQIVSPWSQLLTEASAVLWGVVLAMAFLPPLAQRFQGLPANSSMLPTGEERPAAD